MRRFGGGAGSVIPGLAVWLMFACGNRPAVRDGGSAAAGGVGGGGVGGGGKQDAAAGSGGTGLGGAAGTGGAGCVDIVVTPQSVGETATWLPVPLRGGVWRTNSGLHVAWKVYLAVEQLGSTYRPWLFVATFDPATGLQKALRRYDALPPGSTSNDSNIRSISGSADETFAASLRSFDVANMRPRNQTLFLGRLDSDSFQMQVDLEWKSDLEDVADIAWDGEAFAVHAKLSGVGGGVFVARVDTAGRLLLPSTRFGSTPSAAVEYRMSTNPTSGMTYLFDAPTSGLGRYLSAHDRSGQALPWAPKLPLNLVIPGLATRDAVAVHPGIAADDEGGAWLVWDKDGALGGFVRVAAHVTTSAEVDRWSIVSEHSGFGTPAVSATSSSRVWIAAGDGYAIHSYGYDNGGSAPPRLVVEGPPPPNDPTYVWDVRDLYAFDWQGERWLSFSEHSTILHIVKVSDTCTYRAAFRPSGP